MPINTFLFLFHVGVPGWNLQRNTFVFGVCLVSSSFLHLPSTFSFCDKVFSLFASRSDLLGRSMEFLRFSFRCLLSCERKYFPIAIYCQLHGPYMRMMWAIKKDERKEKTNKAGGSPLHMPHPLHLFFNSKSSMDRGLRTYPACRRLSRLATSEFSWNIYSGVASRILRAPSCICSTATICLMIRDEPPRVGVVWRNLPEVDNG